MQHDPAAPRTDSVSSSSEVAIEARSLEKETFTVGLPYFFGSGCNGAAKASEGSRRQI